MRAAPATIPVIQPRQASLRGLARTTLPPILAVVLIVVGWAWGSHLNDLGRPILLDAPPLFGEWDLRIDWKVLAPIAIAALVITAAPRLTVALSFRRLLATTAGVAAIWILALALTGGFGGIFDPLTQKPEYLGGVGFIDSPGTFLATFTDRIDAFPTHIRSHPPGFVLGLWGLGQIGLGGTHVASLLVVAVAASTPIAALLALRALAGEGYARGAAPFLALFPGAVWIATTADGLYMGVGAWAVACLVLALTADPGRRADLLALAGGLLFGACAFLSYGLMLLALIPLVVAVDRRRLRPLVIAAGAVLAVMGAFLAAGFNWIDGYLAIRDQYLGSIAAERPYEYFLLNNLAAFAICAGPAFVLALARSRPRPAWLLVGGALAIIAVADLSGMSKAEVERIWLPFLPWALLAVAALPRTVGWMRGTLAAQAAVVIAVQVGVSTPW